MEVLVVIAVLAILLGILVPALNRVREQGRSIACAGNLRQLTLGLNVYDQEYGRYPYGFMPALMRLYAPPCGWAGTGTHDVGGWWWFNFLDGVVPSDTRNPDILRCPSRPALEQGSWENVLCGNYGMNQAIGRSGRGLRELGFVGEPLASHEIPLGSEALLLVDSGYAQISWRAAVEPDGGPVYDAWKREDAFYLPGLELNARRTIAPKFQEDALGGRHLNRSVCASFVDGHVERTRAEDLHITQTETGSYENRSPLWLPSRAMGN